MVDPRASMQFTTTLFDLDMHSPIILLFEIKGKIKSYDLPQFEIRTKIKLPVLLFRVVFHEYCVFFIQASCVLELHNVE